MGVHVCSCIKTKKEKKTREHSVSNAQKQCEHVTIECMHRDAVPGCSV